MICECCGKEHDGSYKIGRFCSVKCAKRFATKYDNPKETKEVNCIKCNKPIYVNKRAPYISYMCDCCKKENMITLGRSRVKTCSICGEKYIGRCNNEFCRKHKITSFNNIIKYFGFDKTKLGTPYAEQEFNRIRDYVYKLYWVDGLSSVDIAKRFNIQTRHCITQTILKVLEIPIRTFAESSKNSVIKGKWTPNNSNMYKSGHHITWDGKDVYLRSSYEFDYAKQLDDNKITYEVEKFRIPYNNTETNEICVAIPDFYLPETNTIVEVKSDWTLNVSEMKDKANKYKDLGYNFVLILEHKEVDIFSM